MKPAFLLSLTVAIAFGSGSPGIRPRADVTDYPMHQAGPDVTIGAAVIPARRSATYLCLPVSRQRRIHRHRSHACFPPRAKRLTSLRTISPCVWMQIPSLSGPPMPKPSQPS